MIFYTKVDGCMILYYVKIIIGDFTGLDAEQVGAQFGNMLADPVLMMAMMVIVVLLGFAVCVLCLQNVVEKIT